MKTKFKFLATMLIGIVLSVNVWGADYTLSFTKLERGDNYNNYTAAHSIEVGDFSWSVFGNQSQDNDLRVGGKNTNNTNRTITLSDSEGLNIAVSKVIINHGGIFNKNNTSITINSIKIEVDKYSNFPEPDVVTKNNPSVTSAGSLEFTPTSGSSWDENSFYRITINNKVTVTSGNADNCGIIINNIVFQESSGIEYNVTWKVNNAVYEAGGSTTAPGGGKVSALPTAPEPTGGCAGSTFMGWTASTTTNFGDTPPSDLFKDVEHAPAVTEDVTYHAVFADENE